VITEQPNSLKAGLYFKQIIICEYLYVMAGRLNGEARNAAV